MKEEKVKEERVNKERVKEEREGCSSSFAGALINVSQNAVY